MLKPYSLKGARAVVRGLGMVTSPGYPTSEKQSLSANQLPTQIRRNPQ